LSATFASAISGGQVSVAQLVVEAANASIVILSASTKTMFIVPSFGFPQRHKEGATRVPRNQRDGA
jgi:hypothetical protein